MELSTAHRVLEVEIEGLKALYKSLDNRFLSAVEVIASIQGRVIVSGMGKSGHIARKIAATLASTGTPALFVHPGEASHGDLGMITKNDAVILLSNSGETKELHDIIDYTRRFSIPLIGVVRRPTSALVESADVALVLPEIPEACSVHAPTTSTTMMLALGDALAITLLERRGFSSEDFSVFHPGGKLGSALLRVENIMHSGAELPLVHENAIISDILLEMTSKRLGCTGVINKEETLLGIITDGDLRRHLKPQIMRKVARDIMTQNPRTIRAKNLATEALRIMEERSITQLFIVEDNKPIGVVHIHDILRSGVA